MLAFLFLAFCCAPCLRAETPRDELLRLAPPDAGFCLVIHDVRAHADALRQSEFMQKFRASPLGAALAQTAETKQFLAWQERVEEILQIKWAQFRDDILGDAIVLAYRPPSRQGREPEEELMLLHARDAELLRKLFERLNEVHRAAGDLKELQTRAHNGATYYCRVEAGGSHFCYLRGPVLAFSSRESVIRGVIDRDKSRQTTSLIAERLRELGAGNGVVALWVNPRVFEPAFRERIAQAPAQDAAVLQTVLSYWKALDGIALWADLQKNCVEFSLALAARDGEAPAPLANLFSAELAASELWSFFPEDAIFALAGRVDLPALADLVARSLTEDARKVIRDAVVRGAEAVMGLDIGKEVLPYLGPDWGCCVSAPPKGDTSWFPHIVWALRVRPGNGAKPVDRALWDLLNSYTTLAVLDHNNRHAERLTIKSLQDGPVEIKYLTGGKDFPPGVQPAYAFKNGYLVLASSPEAIRNFAPRPQVAASNGETLFLRLSLRRLRSYLSERRDALVDHIARVDRIDKAEAGRRLEGLLSLLQFFDRMEISRRAAPGRLKVTVRVRTEYPLR